MACLGVDADDIAGSAEVDGGKGEDAGAAAEVEDGIARLHAVLQRFHAHARSRVLAGAERHAGVEADDDLAGQGFVFTPGWANRDLPDVFDLVVLFPRLGILSQRAQTMLLTARRRRRGGCAPGSHGDAGRDGAVDGQRKRNERVFIKTKA